MSFVMITAMMLTLAVGCSSNDTPAADNTEPSSATQSVTPEITGESPVAPPEEQVKGLGIPGDNLSMYPITDEKITLTFWGSYDVIDRPTGIIETPADLSAWAYIEELTNVHIEHTYVVSDIATEKFPIMVASGEWCDMIAGAGSRLSGGLQEGLDTEFLMDISPYIEEYMPNYWAYLNEDKERLAGAILDDGRIGGAYSFASEILSAWGMAVRGDWLKELNMKAPETYDELYDTLVAFKTTYNCTSAFLLTQALQPSYYLAGGYGVSGFQQEGMQSHTHMFQKDGVVTSSLVEDGYREYLEMLNLWHNDGLISQDFITINWFPISPDNQKYLLNDSSGVAWSNVNLMSDIKSLTDDPDFELIGMVDPVKNVGDVTHFQTQNTMGRMATSLSASCSNVEAALMYIDYMYTKDAAAVTNYGVYGENWRLADDEMNWDDIVAGNVIWDEELIFKTAGEFGINPLACTKDYTIGTNFGSALTLERRLFAFYEQSQKDIYETWADHVDGDYLLPTSMSFTVEEQAFVNEKLADIETYASENLPQFISGNNSFADWDAFTAQVMQLGMDKVISVYQAALDRYNERLASL